MPKCDFNKNAKQLYGNRTSAWVFRKFAAYFQNTFSRNTSGWLLLYILKCLKEAHSIQDKLILDLF